MFIANPKHVDIAFKHRRRETNKKNIKASNGYHKQHHKKKKTSHNIRNNT